MARRDLPVQAEGLLRELGVERLGGTALSELRDSGAARVGVAVSGGADSVCLLLLLWAALPGVRDRMCVLHFNHRLRGRSSDADATFVAAVARGLGVPCEAGVWAEPQTDEAAARTARLGFFARTLGTGGVVALGHQAEDVAETLLQRLARGGGVEGLSGPRPVQRMEAHGLTLVRPLLGLRRAELRAAASAAGVRWREDRSNATRRHERNRLRLDVLPELDAAVRRSFAAGAVAARERLDAEREALEHCARQQFEELRPPGGQFCRADIQNLPVALAERVLRLWLESVDRGAGALAPRLLSPAQGEREWSLSDGSTLRTTAHGWRIVSGPVPADWGGRFLAPGESLTGRDGAVLAARSIRVTSGKLKTRERGMILEVLVSARAASDGLAVRSRRPGDRMRPFGAGADARVQNLLINRKIRRELRDNLPVVTTRDGTILWIAGLPPSEHARVEVGERQAVQLTYSPPRAP